MTWRLLVCSGCGGEALRLELVGGLAEAVVGVAPCLGVCAEPVTLAAQGEGRATYVFSGLCPDDLEDVRAFVAAYTAAPAGWLEDARPLGRLRHRLVSRIPAMTG